MWNNTQPFKGSLPELCVPEKSCSSVVSANRKPFIRAHRDGRPHLAVADEVLAGVFFAGD